MTAGRSSTRTHESIINDTLARLLRDRLGLSTAAETMHGRARPDIVVHRPEGPVVLEVELEPAATVDADALARLGLEIDGRPIQTAFAVTVPARLRAIDQRHLDQRLAAADLTWREWRLDGTSGPKLSGGVTELGNAAARATPPASNLEEAVEVLDEGVRRAGSRLYRSPGTLARVATIFSAPPSDEAAHMAALVVTNAMVFQERLASADAAIQPTSASRHNGVFSRCGCSRCGTPSSTSTTTPSSAWPATLCPSFRTSRPPLCWKSARKRPRSCWAWARWAATTWPGASSTG